MLTGPKMTPDEANTAGRPRPIHEQCESEIRLRAYHASLASRTNAEYNNLLESRVDYRIINGGRRHMGYWESASSSAFPHLREALVVMEMRMIQAMPLQAGSRILDAGCGHGHVSVTCAQQKGWYIEGVDLDHRHVSRARSAVRSAGLESMISIAQGDFGDLRDKADNSFDGAFSMEALMAGNDVSKAVREMFRVLKPGGIFLNHRL